MEIRDRKAAQRRAGIMARRGLPQAERAAANAAICARILAMPCFQKAENLLLYAAFGGEVDLAGLAEQAARLGKTVAYPVCGENFALTAAVPGPDGWEVGAYGIRTPVLERAYVFNPEDYLGTWRSKNGRVKIKIKKLSQKSVTFTYSQTNKKKTATCKAKVKKSVAGNATRFSFTDSLGNVAKGYLTFDNGRLYVNIKTKTKAEGAKVHPSVDTVMIKE